MIEIIISDLIDLVDGELTSRSRVIDALLDLRNAAAERSDITSHIDALLGDIPGVNTVPNGWWLDQLSRLRTLVDKPLSPI